MSDKERPLGDTLAAMPLWKVLTYIGVQTLAFTALGLALWFSTDRSLWQFVSLNGNELLQGLALALALIATSAGLARIFPRYVEWLVRSQARNYPFLQNRISMAAIVFISLCAGIGEEALFRGGLQTLLGDHSPMPLALMIAAALFSLIHFAQPLNSALIFAIGCLFGWIYWQTGSLTTVMVAHAVYDVYALWALQEAMHQYGVFDEVLPEGAERETLAS